MRVFIVLLAACAALGAIIDDSTLSYEGAKVYSVTPKTEEQATALFQYRNVDGYDFLRRGHRLGDTIDILVIAAYVESFEDMLTANDISYNIRSENIKEAIDEEAARQKIALASRTDGGISFDAYHRYDTIVAYMQELAAKYSDIVTVFQLGTSYEGRIIYAIKISSGGSNKPAVLIDSAIHAREWIAPAVATYIINQLVEESSNADLIENVDWYIVPVQNPDGYEFSHTNNRLWRKTRSVNINNWMCRGVDGNRNYGHFWMENGASSNPCAETFAGTEPFSAPETQVLRDFVLANKDTIKLYLSFHSYGDYILYPWGYTSELPDDAEELDSLARAAGDAIASYRGTQYTIGSSTNVLYAAAGGSDDWVKAVGGVDLSYCLEFSGGGVTGFDLPASEIIHVATESLKGIRVMAEYVGKKFQKIDDSR